MGKIELLLLDEDELYGERLAAYIRGSEFAARVRVRQFTEQQLAEDWLADTKRRSQSMLVVSDEFYQLARRLCADVCAVVISETFADCGRDDGLLVLYRFQSIHANVSEMLAYFDHQPNCTQTPVHSTQVISVYSAVGGSGKTVTALHLAKQLAFRGQRVFYLSLETSSTVHQLLQSDQPQHFSELIYYAKTSPEQLGVKLEQLKSHDPQLGIDYAAPAESARETLEMGAQEVRQLLAALVSLNRYECIIVDLESSLHPRVKTALEQSDAVWWLVLDDFSCLHKTGTYRNLLPSLAGIRFVVNKFTGVFFNEFERHAIPVSACLPYIPEWKTVNAPQQIFANAVFSAQVHELYVTMMHEAMEGRQSR